MTLIMVYLTLLLCLPAVVAKISLLPRWASVAYGGLFLAFCLVMTDYASLAPRAQILQYTTAPRAREAVAILVTAELLLVLSYAFRKRGKSPRALHLSPVRQRLSRLMAPIRVLLRGYVTPLVFPTLFFLQVQLCYALPGVSFYVPAGIVGGCALVFIPLFTEVLRRTLSVQELREELMLILSLLLCICALLSTATDVLLYLPADSGTGLSTPVAITLAVILLLFIISFFVQKNRTYKLK